MVKLEIIQQCQQSCHLFEFFEQQRPTYGDLPKMEKRSHGEIRSNTAMSTILSFIRIL